MRQWRVKRWWEILCILPVVFFWFDPQCLQAQQHALEHQREEKDTAPAVPILTLADVIERALQDNRNLISSAYGVESQQLSVTITQSEFDLKFFPWVGASTSDGTHQFDGGLGVEKKFEIGAVAGVYPRIYRHYGSDDGDSFGSQYGISLSVPLLRGFGSEVNLKGVKSSEYAMRTAERSYYQAKIFTVLEAVTAVYNIIEQRELVYLYEDQVRRLNGHAVMANAREQIGLATPIDVYRAQIRLKDAQNNLTRAQESLRNAGDRLKIVIATPLDQAVKVVAPMDCAPVDITVIQAVETALAQRVEIEQLKDDIDEAERASRVAKHNLYPDLKLAASYNRWGVDDVFGGIAQDSEEVWRINLAGTTDWSRTVEKAIYHQSQIDIKRVRLNRSIRIENIKREVRQYYDALLKARDRMKIRNDQIQEAEGKLAMSKIKFDHAMANNFDLIEAETELQEARSNFLAAQTEYIVDTYRLRAAMGTLID